MVGQKGRFRNIYSQIIPQGAVEGSAADASSLREALCWELVVDGARFDALSDCEALSRGEREELEEKIAGDMAADDGDQSPSRPSLTLSCEHSATSSRTASLVSSHQRMSLGGQIAEKATASA